MPYITDRIVHDADAHVFEAPGWLEPWVDETLRHSLREFTRVDEGAQRLVAKARAGYEDPEFLARNEAEITLRKGFTALGAFIKEERPAAIDHLGVASQLVFTTGGLRPLAMGERGEDPDIAYGVATAHNRAMMDFCSVDARLLPVLYVPILDIERAVSAAREAIDMGAAALMLPSACPRDHSPSHIGFEPLWAMVEAAGIPVVYHVGGGTALNPVYKVNGLPPVKDFIGGDDNFTSVSYMAIPEAPMQTLATLIFDGVLERYPRLKFGVIEMGASWLPGWMRSMDSCAVAFTKNETRLQALELTPSEYVRRQVRVTPYPHEPAGWIIRNSGPEVCLFSSDYPHVEGGRNPLKRFEASLDAEQCSEAERDAFYRFNYEDLMGSAMQRLAGRAVR
ncbi:MAG: amidohydrolase family protein [Pseudomonadales bacterium]|nr:amidohydrolase family protein [Pseudomonadales bacterium]